MKQKAKQTDEEFEKQFQKEDTFKITVIINVHECGERLKDCIKSVKNQTFGNIEVFLCNNGDEEIAENIAEDDRFTVIKKDGETDCRNIAIKKADGKFLSFIDGNDRLRKDFLENLYDGVNDTDSDIAVCGYCYFYPNKRRKRGKLKPTIFQPSDNKTFARGQALYLLLPDRPIRYFLWNKLFKKELFTENNIIIPDTYYEDVITCTRLFYYAKQVITLEDGSYFYTQPDKIYDKKFVTVKHINDYIKTVALVRMFLEEKNCYEIFKQPFISYAKQVKRAIPFLIMRVSKQCENGGFANTKTAKNKIKFYLSCSKEEILSENINEDVIK